MTTLTKFVVGVTIALFTLMSCDNSASLQQYLVDKQDDDKFLKVDLATSLLKSNEANFSEEEQEVLNTVKKINVVAYPIKEGSQQEYDQEMQRVKQILDGEQYQTLMKMGSNKSGASLKYVGENGEIDELIVFASDDEKGFAVFRLLGDKMRPDSLIKLMNSIDQGDIDITSLKSIGDLFDVDADMAEKVE
jgi:hypothetical protein